MKKIHNMFGYDPNYDDEILGKANLCLAKDIPKDIKIIRAGVILYQVKKEVKPSWTYPTHYPKLHIKPITLDEVESELEEIKFESPNPWFSNYRTYPGTQVSGINIYNNSIFNNRCSSIFTSISEMRTEAPPIIDYRPKLIPLCRVDSNRNSPVEDDCKYEYINSVCFCMGVDSTYGTLSDFSGKIKKEESAIQAANRELREEGFGIFNYTLPELEECICVYNNELVIIFAPLKISPQTANSLFDNKYQENKLKRKSEMVSLKWLDQNQFVNTVNLPYVVYEPVRALLSVTVGNIIKSLVE